MTRKNEEATDALLFSPLPLLPLLPLSSAVAAAAAAAAHYHPLSRRQRAEAVDASCGCCLALQGLKQAAAQLKQAATTEMTDSRHHVAARGNGNRSKGT
jgi:hypothetical protein